jgi:hypothetical protein
MTLFKRLLINLLAPPAVMAVIHAIWKVEIVADLPTAWAVVYLFALLLPAWLIAEAFNQLMLRIGSFRATPSYLRYFVAAIPIPFLSLLWARDVRAIVVGLTPDHIINNAYLPTTGGLDPITLFLVNWLPWMAVWIGFKLIADRLGWALEFSGGNHRIQNHGDELPSGLGPANSAELPAVLDRAGFRAMPRLDALQAQEHYVVVHSDLGEKIVRYKMNDAVDECHFLDGIRVHRSWWVAKHAITAVRPRGRSVAVKLPSGEWVPVSIASKQAVVEASLQKTETGD